MIIADLCAGPQQVNGRRISIAPDSTDMRPTCRVHLQASRNHNGHSKPWPMSPNDCASRTDMLSDSDQLAGFEARGHGGTAIVHREVAPTKNKASQRQENISSKMALNIYDYNCSSRVSLKVRHICNRRIVRKVVKQQRTEHKIEATLAERKGGCVGNDARGQCRPQV